MQNSFNQPDQLRQRIADLKAEIGSTEAEAAPIFNRVSDLTAVITNAPAEEHRFRFHHADLGRVRAAKSAAYSERAELQIKIQDNKRQVDALKGRLIELQNDLHRAEYEAVTVDELSALLSQQVAAIQAVDSERDDLTFERDTLQQKRLEAQQATAAVDSAERELRDAQEGYDQTQAEAFISGENVDLSAHVDRIGKAEKRLATVQKGAAAGRAALPRISVRLTAIEVERVELDSRRTDLINTYWNTRKRLVEIDYREQLQRVIEAGRRLAALHVKTGKHFSHDLINGLKGLKRPKLGKYFEDVRSVDSNFVDILAEFECELSAALNPI